MKYTFDELKKKKVAELREIAAGLEHEAVKGYTQMNKDHLFASLCTALGIDMHKHHIAHLSGKTKIKSQIKQLKTKRAEAVAAKNRRELKTILRSIHNLKRELRKAAK